MLRISTPRRIRCVANEPSGGGSRETDCDEGAALERSERVKEPEEATESMTQRVGGHPLVDLRQAGSTGNLSTNANLVHMMASMQSLRMIPMDPTGGCRAAVVAASQTAVRQPAGRDTPEEACESTPLADGG